MKKLGKGTVMFGCENTPFRLYLIVFFVLYYFSKHLEENLSERACFI